jgi:hypothetical protein
VPAAVVRPGAATGAISTRDGSCNQYSNGTGDFCFWAASGFAGTFLDFYGAESNLNLFTYPNTATPVGANSRSALNADLLFSADVWTGVGFTGLEGVAPPGSGGNFIPAFTNTIQSLRFI